MPEVPDVTAWIVRPRPHHINRIEEFLSGGFIATGWPRLGNLSRQPPEQIRRVLRRAYPEYDAHALGHATGQLDRLVNQMAGGDYVLISDRELGSALYIGEVSGDYRYERSKDNDVDGYPHQRPVRWLAGRSAVPLGELSQDLRQSLKAHQPITRTNGEDVRRYVREHVTGGPLADMRLSTVEDDQFDSALEGELVHLLKLHRKRDRRLRLAKIRQVLRQRNGRLACEVPRCGFDFAAVYGLLGLGYAQVHHKKPLSSLHEEEEVRLEDLIIVCANCHVMIHRGGDCRSVAKLIGPGRGGRKGLQ